MKAMYKKRLLSIIALTLLILPGLVYFTFAKINAYNTTMKIVESLEMMQISDFVRSTELEVYFAEAEDAEFICYSSDSNQLVFHFDQKTGRLLRADSYALIFPDEANTLLTTDTSLTDAQQEAESLVFAQKLISGHQIGELELERIDATQLWDRFYVTEYYDGEPTGTTITVAWEGNHIMSGIPHYGNVFSKDESGKIVRNNSSAKINEEDALTCAIKAVGAYANGYTLRRDTASCNLKILHGDYCYEVSIVASSMSDDGYDLSFIILLDAYTGEVLEIQQSA